MLDTDIMLIIFKYLPAFMVPYIHHRDHTKIRKMGNVNTTCTNPFIITFSNTSSSAKGSSILYGWNTLISRRYTVYKHSGLDKIKCILNIMVNAASYIHNAQVEWAEVRARSFCVVFASWSVWALLSWLCGVCIKIPIFPTCIFVI